MKMSITNKTFNIFSQMAEFEKKNLEEEDEILDEVQFNVNYNEAT